MRTNSKGFSLLELLIVVAIILIIATIAIPSLLRSRQSANETAAVANLRTINVNQTMYQSSSGGRYGKLDDLVQDGLLGSHFGAGQVNGYNYTIEAEDNGSNYTAAAIPTTSNNGRYGYYTGPDGVVRYSSGVPAGQIGTPVTQ